MRVWDSRTQSLTPEWLAASKLAKELCVGDVLDFQAGPARVTKLELRDGIIGITICYMHLDQDEGGESTFYSNPDGRWGIYPGQFPG